MLYISLNDFCYQWYDLFFSRNQFFYECVRWKIFFKPVCYFPFKIEIGTMIRNTCKYKADKITVFIHTK